MNNDIRVLQVEDSASDAELMVRLLKKEGFRVYSERVETAAQMHVALAKHQWEVVIADYRLPHFDAPAALRIVQETGKDIPFIVVSGAIGEDVAVEMMRSGAHDYLLKDRLERLAPAVQREIMEASIRQQHRKAEEDRSAAHSELAAISSNAPVALLVVNTELRIEKANNMAARLSGRSVHHLLGAPVGNAIGCANAAEPGGCGSAKACGGCEIRNAAADTLANGTTYDSLEVWKPAAIDGEGQEQRCLLFSIAPLLLGKSRKALICAQDITLHKRAEQALQETVDRLELALNERAVLFQEVHHRVKNNLQIVSSLLSMQARSLDDAKSVQKLKDTEQRVKAMAMVHEQLYSQKQIASIDLAAYIEKLVPQLHASHPGSSSIGMNLDLTSTTVTLERSIPCALILTELVTNALKYAYPEGKGEILVQLKSDESTLQLTVADQGVGLPGDRDWNAPKALGMSIVRALAAQIKATFEVGPAPGCKFTLRVPREQENDATPFTQLAGHEASSDHKQIQGQVLAG